MNNGIFGEGFPYSNFHDLNMDWIIKIAKDFLDQYSTIQQIITDGNKLLNTTIEEGNTQLGTTISEGITSLQNKYNALEALLQQWYNTHSEDIATELANALHDIQTELSTVVLQFSQQATAIGDEVKASIPADYSKLSATVQTLVSNLINIQGLTQYLDYSRWQANKHWNPQLGLDTGDNYYAYPEITVPAGTYAMCGLNDSICFAKDANGNITTPFMNQTYFVTFATETKLYLSCVDFATGDALTTSLKRKMFGNVIPPRNCYKLGEYGTRIDNAYIKDIIVDHFQVLEDNKWDIDKFWSNAGGTISLDSHSNYYAYPAFMVKAGKYIAKGIDPTFSFYVDTTDNSVHTLTSTAAPNFITLEHDSIIFISKAIFVSDVTTELRKTKFGTPMLPGDYKQGDFGKVIPLWAICKPVYIVDQLGSGDFFDIQTALDNIEDSKTNPVTIIVMPGTYNYFTTAKNNAFSERYVNIIGVDNKTCRVECLSGGYETSAGMVRLTGTIRNLTFYSQTDSSPAPDATPAKYAIHCDYGECKLRLENCILKSACGPAIGIGLSNHQHVEIIDCYCETDTNGHSGWTSGLGCIYCHNGFEENGEDQRITIQNSVAYNVTGQYGACFHEINPADKYLKINNSSFFGNNGGDAQITGTWNKTCSANNNVAGLNA